VSVICADDYPIKHLRFLGGLYAPPDHWLPAERADIFLRNAFAAAAGRYDRKTKHSPLEPPHERPGREPVAAEHGHDGRDVGVVYLVAGVGKEGHGVDGDGGQAYSLWANEARCCMRYTVVLKQEEDGGFVATVPALPGCVSQGDSRDEAIENVREAIALYIEDCRESGEAVPTESGREIVEVEAA